MEELACVYKFLYRRISVAFDDLAMHNIYWGEMRADIFSSWTDYTDVSKDAVLSRGLAMLHQLAAADIFEDRKALIGSDWVPESDFWGAAIDEWGPLFDKFGNLKALGDDSGLENQQPPRPLVTTDLVNEPNLG